MWPFNKEKRVESLIAKAEEALDDDRNDEALRLAGKILAHEHTYGFELKARALTALDRLPEAVAILEEGVRVAPQVPRLWSYLGEYRSEAGDYLGAHAAFTRLAAFPSPSHESAIANDALVFEREGRFDDALDRLAQFGTPTDIALRTFVSGIRVSVLLSARRWDDAIRIGELELEWLSGVEDSNGAISESARRGLGQIHRDVGEAYWRGRKDAHSALEHCLDATRTHRDDHLLALIREIDGFDASKAKPYRLQCEGRAMLVFIDAEGGDSKPRRHGYFVTYWVLADTPAEALGYARRFEARDFGDRLLSFELSESESLTESVAGCKGVYAARLGRTIFLDESTA